MVAWLLELMRKVRDGEPVALYRVAGDADEKAPQAAERYRTILLQCMAAAHARRHPEVELTPDLLTGLRGQTAVLEEILPAIADGIVASGARFVHPSEMEGLRKTITRDVAAALEEWTGPSTSEPLWT